MTSSLLTPAVGARPPTSAAVRGMIGSRRKPGHAIRDGDAGEPVAAAMRLRGQEWLRRRRVSSALVDEGGLRRGGAGSHEADLLRELHERHVDALWSYALRLTGDEDRAQDVVQETLLRAWCNPQILDPECGSQRSWLYAVARNIVIDQGGTTRQHPEIAADRLPVQPIGGAGGQVVDRHLVVAALGRLTQEHRDVLRELCFRGSSIADAAHALGIAPRTVKSRTYYALRALQLAIEELGGVE
jgi:RNA polymerase sigma-70 factor (ECF subfamily)